MTESFDIARNQVVCHIEAITQKIEAITQKIEELDGQREIMYDQLAIHRTRLLALDDARRLLTEMTPAEPEPQANLKYTRRNPGADAEPETVIADKAVKGAPDAAAVSEGGEGRTAGLIPATGATPDARVLSSPEFIDQSNALRQALEKAGADGIVIHNAMVAPEVVEEAVIAGWANRGPGDHDEWLWLSLNWIPEGTAK